MIDDIINKEYRLCDLKEREKSVLYIEIDVDSLLIDGVNIDEDNLIEIIDPDVANKLI
ncbi:hypothetical protein [Peptostreptococcus canis]|uniref:Uncharacterized protein n=1 Tax=Peptostreptococcus canis TaxID=1159213 RepID=A0ABR6TKJ1_9FIRM|nr:hypothetical protein [Peptostreptococcus canis]MBC2575925.1 hypothetical protein [Peptostreptococcus canis]MBP1997954.1 hypothetical protein [Peptostreptococcus canis]